MRSSVCVDASLLIRVLVPGPYSDIAHSRMAMWLADQTAMLAPALAAYEVTSTLRRLVHLRAITPEQGDTAFQQFLLLDIRFSNRRDMFPLAWKLAKRLNRPRAYDTAYIALARLSQCELWTADERLYNAVRGDLPEVRWLGEAAQSD